MRHRTLLIIAALLAVAIVPVVAGLIRLVTLATGPATASDARFFAHPWPVTLHILAVVPYSLLSPLQFAPALRRHHWHRTLGMALVPLGLIAALTGLWMTCVYPWPAGDGRALYVMRLMAGTVMTLSITSGIASLTRRNYVKHGVWMLRGYALGMGAGTQVFTHLPWFVFVDTAPDEVSRAFMMGLAWLINAAIAELVIRNGGLASGTYHRRQPTAPRLQAVREDGI